MLRRQAFSLLLAPLLGPVFPVALNAQERPRWTAITVDEMCWACARRITRKLEPMESVGKIECCSKTNRVFVLPKENHSLSPRRLWESLEEIGKSPKKLVGPAGTFTSKPK